MKYYIIAFLNFILLSQSAFTQNWAPIGATWHYTADRWLEISFNKIISEKDTVILDQTCQKLTSSLGESGKIHSDYPTRFVYQDGQKVYAYIPSMDKFGLLYDFSKNAGEFWIVETNFYDFEVRVDSVGVVQINDSLRKIQYVDDDGLGHFRGAIIEGIGHTQYLFPMPGLADPARGPLRCYEDSALGLYQHIKPGQTQPIACDSTWNTFLTEEDLYPIGTEWHYELLRTFGPYRYHSFYTERITKDTIIHDKVCKVRRGFDSEGNAYGGRDILFEENGKVYRYFSVPDYFGLIYDFNLDAGENYIGTIGDGYYSGGVYVWDTLETALVNIDSVSTITINQQIRKVQYVSPDRTWDFGIPMIIEGIGGLYGSFFPQSALADGLGGGVTALRCYSDSALGLFQNVPYPCDSIWEEQIDNIDESIHASIHIYPNPVQDHFTVNIDDGNTYFSSIQLIDMKGRILKKVNTPSPQRVFTIDMASFASGIYVLEVEFLSGERIRTKLVKE